MNTNGRFECDICNLSFKSKKEYLKHTSTSEHIRQTEKNLIDDAEAETAVDVDIKAITKSKAKAKAEADREVDDCIVYSRKNNCIYCKKNLQARSL